MFFSVLSTMHCTVDADSNVVNSCSRHTPPRRRRQHTHDSLDLIEKLPCAKDYNSIEYHTPLLKEYVSNTDDGGTAKRRSSKNGGDHTNPRVVRRGTYMADNLVHRGGSLRDLTSRSDGDAPVKGKQGSFRKHIKNGSNHGPRARRAQHSQSARQ